MSHIFISYARKDAEFAQKINSDLRDRGIPTWIDEIGIRAFEDWPKRIAKAIKECEALLVVLSPESMSSSWVERELAYADSNGKRVLPIVYQECDLPADFELRFGNVQRMNFARGNYEDNLPQLLNAITQLTGWGDTSPITEVITKTSKDVVLEDDVKRKPKPRKRESTIRITSPIDLEMKRVPAGEFLIGSDPDKDRHAAQNEQPQHYVYVSEFYISKYPVTKTQYAMFVLSAHHSPPGHWKKGTFVSGFDNHPIVNVTWDDATAFCEWLSQQTGKNLRLPTEAEWEKAARGTDERIYPWGNEWDGKKCHSSGDFFTSFTRVSTAAVGQCSPSGDSPYGVSDMSGNVWEWCLDWFDERAYPKRIKAPVKNPTGPKSGTYHVARGGSWADNRKNVRAAVRYGGPPKHSPYLRSSPKIQYYGNGFRIAYIP
jgi:formylglycine-generating enzyme required for sulfatase activity